MEKKILSYLPTVEKLSPLIYRILGCNPGLMTLQGTNTYLIGNGDKRILLDTGEGNNFDYNNALKSVLDQENIKIDKIIISHWHKDHSGGLYDVQNLVGEEILSYKFIYKHDDKKYIHIKEGDILACAGATLKVLHTPGHTSDHLSLLLQEENAVFCGDCILGEGTTRFEDLCNYMQSLYKILHLEPTRMYPGHGPVITQPISTIHKYIKHRQTRENEILTILQQNYPLQMTVPEIVEQIYKNIAAELHPAAAINVQQHINKLVNENKIKMNCDNKYSYRQPKEL